MVTKLKDMTTNTTTISKVRNYQGTNSFIQNLKQSLNKFGGLTPRQMDAAEKVLMSTTEVKIDELSEDMQKIAKYDGPNTFINDIKSKLMKYGTLTENQVRASLNQIQKDENKKNTHKMNIPTIGETIKVGRGIGERLKETYGLKFNPILLDITKVLGVSPKAVKFEAKLTEKRGKVCCVCARTLTDELSMLSGVGKLCSEHVGVPYLKDKSQAETFRQEYLKRIEEIGTMEVWVPKSQIKIWDGNTEIILKMI